MADIDREETQCGRKKADNFYWYSNRPGKPPTGGADCQECEFAGFVEDGPPQGGPCNEPGSWCTDRRDVEGRPWLYAGRARNGSSSTYGLNAPVGCCNKSIVTCGGDRPVCARNWAEAMTYDRRLACCTNTNHSKLGEFDYFRDCDPEWAGPGCSRTAPSDPCKTFLPARCVAPLDGETGLYKYGDWDLDVFNDSEPGGKCRRFVQNTQDVATRNKILNDSLGAIFADPSPYIFLQGTDTLPGGDVGGQRPELKDDAPALKAACDAEPLCVGFNTNGWVKDRIGALRTHPDLSGPGQGLYVKAATLPLPRGFEATEAADAAHLSQILNYCGENPGACDATLTDLCKGETRQSLRDAYSAVSDPLADETSADFLNNLNKIKACGCHLPLGEYADFAPVLGATCQVDGETVDNNPIPCDPLCKLSGAISPVSSVELTPVAAGIQSNGGEVLTCCSTNCFIDDIAINLIGTSPRTINFTQVCPSAREGQLSNCYFGDNIILNEAGNSALNFRQECDQCFIYHADDPGNPTLVACPTGESSSGLPGLVQTFLQRFGLPLGIGLGVVVLALVVFGVVLARRAKAPPGGSTLPKGAPRGSTLPKGAPA